MEQLTILAIGFAYSIALLVLMSAGLALIFGMMRVINLAHGEFMVLGGYAAVVSTQYGINFWLAVFVIAPLIAGLFGLAVERIVVRRLYGRMVDSMLATWGLSFLMTGLLTTVFGNTTSGIANPLGAVALGSHQVGGYSLFIIGVAAALMTALYMTLKRTRIGLIVRGAMQSPEVAAALGYDPQKIFLFTFGAGAAISGLAGAVLAPMTGLTPGSGGQYIAKAFITVISGGASVIGGTLSASALYGAIGKSVEMASSAVAGEIALLAAAVVLIRLLPQGITGRFFKGSV